MELIKNQESLNQVFTGYLKNPASISLADAGDMELLLQKYPFCQLLHAFETRALKGQDSRNFEKQLAKASIYSPNRNILYNLLNHPENLTGLKEIGDDEAIIIEEEFSDPDFAEHPAEDIAPDPEEDTVENITPDPEEDTVEEDEVFEEISEEIYPAPSPAEEIETPLPPDNLLTLSVDQETAPETSEEPEIEEEPAIEVKEIDDEEKMIIGNIASSDFFAFGEQLAPRVGDHSRENAVVLQDVKFTSDEPEQNLPAVEPSVQNQDVSRYDDDTLPYSFLWWLHKTRREYADTYQPYIRTGLNNRSGSNPGSPQLNQQIIENIFHLQSPLDEMNRAAAHKTIQFELKRKEEEIIERFIREEPQIKPPSSDKLDIENKARKSAEDPNDLVSETLAVIYTEQMLFHKAIDTYTKLSLKYPEKRTYFADQIRELEKKIN